MARACPPAALELSVPAVQGKSIGVLDPHAYAVADRAYRSMKSSRMSQSVIISGESGAGKTGALSRAPRHLEA